MSTQEYAKTLQTCPSSDGEMRPSSHFVASIRRSLLAPDRDSKDPIHYLNILLRSFFENLELGGCAIWARLANGKASVIHDLRAHADSPKEDYFEGSEWESAFDHAILLQQPTWFKVPSGSVNGTSCVCVLLPVRASGDVRAVYSLIVPDYESLDEPAVESLSQAQQFIELHVAEIVERARIFRANALNSRIRNDAMDTEPSADLNGKTISCDTGTNSLVERKWVSPPDLAAFVSHLSGELDPKGTAYLVVNELRSLLGIGRIGIYYRRGRFFRLEAISGLASLNTKSELVQRLNLLATEVAQLGTALWHPGDDVVFSESIGVKLDEYYSSTDGRSIALIPIRERAKRCSPSEPMGSILRKNEAEEGKVIAMVSIEGLRESLGREEFEPLWNAIAPFIGNTVTQAVRLRQIPGFRIGLLFADLVDCFFGERRRQVLAISALFAFFVVGLFVLPADLKLRVDGSIQPIQRCRIYCEVPGTISRIIASEGKRVKAGERLLVLENPQLEIEYQRVHGELSEVERSLSLLRNHLNAGRVQDENQARGMRNEKTGLEARWTSLQRQAHLLEEKRRRLIVTSPIEGQPITWDLQSRLSNRPVEVGQHLMTIADPSGDWNVELRVPDHLSGYLERAIRSKQEVGGTKVDFFLASDPHTVYRGFVEKVSDSQVLDKDQGRVTLVTVRIESDSWKQIRQIRPGTEVIAHIRVRKSSLGHSFIFEFRDWLRRQYFRYLG